MDKSGPEYCDEWTKLKICPGCRLRDQAIVMSDVEAYEVSHGSPFDWNLKEVSEALGPLLHKVCKGSAGVKLKSVLKIDGFNAWRVLAFWFQARSRNDSMSLLTMIMNPDRVMGSGPQ